VEYGSRLYIAGKQSDRKSWRRSAIDLCFAMERTSLSEMESMPGHVTEVLWALPKNFLSLIRQVVSYKSVIYKFEIVAI